MGRWPQRAYTGITLIKDTTELDHARFRAQIVGIGNCSDCYWLSQGDASIVSIYFFRLRASRSKPSGLAVVCFERLQRLFFR